MVRVVVLQCFRDLDSRVECGTERCKKCTMSGQNIYSTYTDGANANKLYRIYDTQPRGSCARARMVTDAQQCHNRVGGLRFLRGLTPRQQTAREGEEGRRVKKPERRGVHSTTPARHAVPSPVCCGTRRGRDRDEVKNGQTNGRRRDRGERSPSVACRPLRI